MKLKNMPHRSQRTKGLSRISLSSFIPAVELSVICIVSVLIFFLASCNERNGVVDISKLPKTDSTQVISDTNYIQIQPPWEGSYIDDPKDIKVGFDYFLYVAEPNNNRVVMLNLAGAVIGYSQYVKRPVAIAEDRRFNLLIACEYDTTINSDTVTVAAIAKIALFNHSDSLLVAPVEIVYHESPQHGINRDPVTGALTSGREFTGVAVLPDNSYYVTRSGTSNTSSVDPDNIVLHFDKNGVEYSSDYIDLVPSLLPNGTGFVAINKISNIATFPLRQYGTDFILTQVDPANAFKVKWITFNPGSELYAPSWDSKFSLNPTTYSSGKLPDILSGIFVTPQAVMADDRSNIYIVDSSLDSLMKFDLTGKLLHESFGPSKSGNALLHPSGITYSNKIIYISDTGHNRILRYELSTDLK